MLRKIQLFYAANRPLGLSFNGIIVIISDDKSISYVNAELLCAYLEGNPRGGRSDLILDEVASQNMAQGKRIMGSTYLFHLSGQIDRLPALDLRRIYIHQYQFHSP